MPLIVDDKLPALEVLRRENIPVVNLSPNDTVVPRRLRVAIVNLMPVKETTEADFLRLLSNTSHTVEVDFVEMSTHRSKNTSREHLDKFYRHFSDIKHIAYDGLIITGAPVEKIDFESVDYWEELTRVFDWAKKQVPTTLYICWAALAGLYYHYGIPKHMVNEKISGVFEHTHSDVCYPIFRGFDDIFYVPHSRFSEVRHSDIDTVDALEVVSESDSSGIYMVASHPGYDFFITGHSEYAPDTLDSEYRRDLNKGLNPQIPQNYYRDDDPSQPPVVRWRSHANLLFSNWLDYYVNPDSHYRQSNITVRTFATKDREDSVL